jgi:hypothetical protein
MKRKELSIEKLFRYVDIIFILVILSFLAVSTVHSMLIPAHVNQWGEFNASFEGTYKIATAKDKSGVTETVFYLALDDGQLIRLIFYCGRLSATVYTGIGMSMNISAWNYCTDPSQVSFTVNQRIWVKGTFLHPSAWNPWYATPWFLFTGDLYVFEVQSLR